MNVQNVFILVAIIDNTLSKSYEGLQNMGEYFAIQYLTPDGTIPTLSTIDSYLSGIRRTMNYFSKRPNATDWNIAMGIFLMKCLFKRTINDDSTNIKKYHIANIKDLISKADYVLSHYLYKYRNYKWTDPKYRVIKLFENDEAFTYSIEDFNRNKIRNLIFTENHINKFVEAIDKATFPRKKFKRLVVKFDMEDMGTCMSRVAYNREPVELSKIVPCKVDDYCRDRIIHMKPLVGLGLSRRLLNLLSLRFSRRCHIVSDDDDAKYMDKLCSFMYREVVYLSRHEYFFREVFVEHVALCGLLGYEEFHRRQWFHKVVSWINSNGCILPSNKDISKYLSDCNKDLMAVSIAILAHGVRHAARYMVHLH